MQHLIEKGYIININSILVNNNVINISKEFKFYLISGKSFIDFYIDIYNHILSSIEKNCHKFNEAILFLGLILLLKFKYKLNLLIFENNPLVLYIFSLNSIIKFLKKINLCGKYIYNHDLGLCFKFENEIELNNTIKN